MKIQDHTHKWEVSLYLTLEAQQQIFHNLVSSEKSRYRGSKRIKVTLVNVIFRSYRWKRENQISLRSADCNYKNNNHQIHKTVKNYNEHSSYSVRSDSVRSHPNRPDANLLRTPRCHLNALDRPTRRIHAPATGDLPGCSSSTACSGLNVSLGASCHRSR